MGTHKDLEVWRGSIELVKTIYLLTKEFPKQEVYGITSQIRSAAISIPANIAEGAARTGPKEFRHFLNIAQASLAELETLWLIAFELGFISNENFQLIENKIIVISKQTYRLTKAISQKIT